VSKHTAASGDLERSTGSFPDLVQLVLQGINLPLNLFEGVALRRDEQAPILAPGIAQESNLEASPNVALFA